MAIVDGKGTTFTFNGVTVGRITKYNTIDGVTGETKHQSLSRPYPIYKPGLPEFGSITISLYRDTSDAGQIQMEAARANRSTCECILTLSDGSQRVFPGFVKKLPIVGDDNGLGTADAVIKVAGAMISA